MPNRFAPFVLAAAAWLATTAAWAQAGPPSAARAAPSTVSPVTVQAPAPPKTIRQQTHSFVQSFAAVGNPELDQITRWRDPICVQIVGLDDAQAAAKIKARIEDVARALDVAVLPPGCRSDIQIVFSDKPQAVMDVVAKRNEYLLGYYHRHEHDQLKKVTRPIQAWYVTATDSNNPFAAVGGVALGPSVASGNMNPSGRGSIDDPEQTPPVGCGDSPHFTACLRSEFSTVFVVADSKALAGKDAGLVADYLVMLTLAQPRSLDGCNSLPSVIDLFAKSACLGRDTPDGLTPGDAAYLTALYKADLETRKTFEQTDVSDRMAQILIKASAAGR